MAQFRTITVAFEFARNVWEGVWRWIEDLKIPLDATEC